MSVFTLKCTSTFESKFNELTKKYKLYGSIGKDLYNFFLNQSLETVFEQQQFIDNKAPDYRVIKCRIQNSGKKISEREGFRLYYNVIFKESTVNLLYIYPKTGQYGEDSVDSAFIKLQTKIFVSEKSNNLLKTVSLDSQTTSIEIA